MSTETMDRSGATTGIEWTQRTWNPLAGCSMCSPGCARCYAETMAKRLRAMAEADVAAGKNPGRKRHYLDVIGDNGRWNGKIALIPEALDEPLRRKQPTTWFVNSMSDLFHEGVPFEFVDRVFAVMALTPQHTYQILTKRPERMAEYFKCERGKSIGWMLTDDGPPPVSTPLRTYDAVLWEVDKLRDDGHGLIDGAMVGVGWPLPNVWLGTSIEDCKRMDERAPLLANCPGVVTFWSVEPLLEDLGQLPLAYGPKWVIVGGESGPGARPCNVVWVRSIVEQCRAAGVPVFVKQLGAKPMEYPEIPLHRQGGGVMRDKKGGTMEEWPEDLRVRQMPALPR